VSGKTTWGDMSGTRYRSAHHTYDRPGDRLSGEVKPRIGSRCQPPVCRSSYAISPQSRSAAHTFKDEPIHHECHVTVLVHGEAPRNVDDLRGPRALRGDDRVANEGNTLSLI
jgi:hypothetical protein